MKNIVKTWQSATGNTEYQIGKADRQPESEDLKNYFWICSFSDNEEGGELQLWKDPQINGWVVNDYDGAFDLPKGIKKHLESKGVEL